MSLIDTIKNSLGGAAGPDVASQLPEVIERIVPGGLQGLLNQLSQTGYGKQVNSWLGRGENEPITTQDLSNVLHNEQVRQIAEKLGILAAQVLDTLSKLLPQAVDKHSPEGQLQTPAPGQHESAAR